MRILPTVLVSLVLQFAACGSPETTPPPPSSSSSSASASSSGDPNPPMMCDGPGKGGGGDPCVTACDCCQLDCRVLTKLDGGMTGVCASNCDDDAGAPKRN